VRGARRTRGGAGDARARRVTRNAGSTRGRASVNERARRAGARGAGGARNHTRAYAGRTRPGSPPAATPHHPAYSTAQGTALQSEIIGVRRPQLKFPRPLPSANCCPVTLLLRRAGPRTSVVGRTRAGAFAGVRAGSRGPQRRPSPRG
jgi:hypothetical protein